jgi:hypothetical protein
MERPPALRPSGTGQHRAPVNDTCSDVARDELIPLAPGLIGTASAPVSALLVECCARAALSVRPDLRRLTRCRWPARSFVADAVTVVAEHAEAADRRLVALLRECVDATNCVPHSVYSLLNVGDLRS